MALRHHQLPGTDLRLSTFCCGLGDLFSLPRDQSDAVLDAFVEAGGNFFDTAHCYSFWLPGGNGQSEIGIGEYVRRRGLKNMVIASKGGHPGAVNYRQVDHYLSPGRISADIDDSLGRLQCDSIPLYYLHRDDPRVPVGEIVESLHAEVTRGRLRHLGASNWTIARLTEANDYARAKKLTPFAIVEPRWSLATCQTNPNAADMVTYTETEIAWHHETQFPVAAYSPTAHGFFADPARATEADYGSAANIERRERAVDLAQKRGVTPAQIALAWLTCHPFLVFPILGTKNPERLKEALNSDSIQLTEDELSWLAVGDARPRVSTAA